MAEKADNTKKKKCGRPKIQITEALCRKAENLAAKGLSEEQVAINLGIAYCTLREKKKQFSAFSAAIKKGKAKSIKKVVNALFNNATKENCTTAQIFFLKNRDPDNWKDKHDVEHSGEIGLSDAIKDARKRITESK